jgi:hypothetical protein
MKKTFALVVLTLVLMSSAAMAEERVGDAALGGAVVLGPIGAVAGAVVGFTAGPSIARSWGLGGSSQARPPRRPASPAPMRLLATASLCLRRRAKGIRQQQ